MSDDAFLEEPSWRRIRVSNQLRWARRLAALVFFWPGWRQHRGRFYSFIEEFGWAIMATSGLLCGAASFQCAGSAAAWRNQISAVLRALRAITTHMRKLYA